MAYTNATVIIAAVDQEAAQVDFSSSFTSGFYQADDGADPAIATNYVCSGLWSDEDLSRVVNDVTWQHRVYFGDINDILDSLNLAQISLP